LARVYATVANMGIKPPIESIISVSNYQGKVLMTNKCLQDNFPLREATATQFIRSAFEPTCDVGERILSDSVTFELIDILKDNSARAPAFGSNSQLVIKNHPEVAVKTGTSNDMKDNLTIGFTKDYLTAVWVGNNDNTPMSRIASGVTGAAPIWNKIMTYLLDGKSSYAWDIPEGLTKVKICTYTGTLPCEGCPTKEEWFKETDIPKTYCSKEAIQKINEEKSKILEGASTNINSQFPSVFLRQFGE
jgi:membrane carboxypeptidase/penicillin-binding protein PbpC